MTKTKSIKNIFFLLKKKEKKKFTLHLILFDDEKQNVEVKVWLNIIESGADAIKKISPSLGIPYEGV